MCSIHDTSARSARATIEESARQLTQTYRLIVRYDSIGEMMLLMDDIEHNYAEYIEGLDDDVESNDEIRRQFRLAYIQFVSDTFEDARRSVRASILVHERRGRGVA